MARRRRLAGTGRDDRSDSQNENLSETAHILVIAPDCGRS
jgi:hypothetical protein